LGHSIAVSFLVICTGALLGILGKIIAILSLAFVGAVIIIFPLAISLILPSIFFAYLYAKKKGYYQPYNSFKKKEIVQAR
jgi:hypothetical protein